MVFLACLYINRHTNYVLVEWEWRWTLEVDFSPRLLVFLIEIILLFEILL
jgi:hypothetical protein